MFLIRGTANIVWGLIVKTFYFGKPFPISYSFILQKKYVITKLR